MTPFNNRWGRANKNPPKALKMGDCPTCKKRMTFVGFRCIHCGTRMPWRAPQRRRP